MFDKKTLTRRNFFKGAGAAGALLYLGQYDHARAIPLNGKKSVIFRVDDCPVHDLELRHRGVDALLKLLADNGMPLYKTGQAHPWSGPNGMVAPDDVVLVKVNCQWQARGTTNTDVVRGLIHRILQHPEGFQGEVVIFENGQGQGAFDGTPGGWGHYSQWPDIDNSTWVNAEEQGLLTVDYLVNTVFGDSPVSAFLLDDIRSDFISPDDHTTDGYRIDNGISYPCFTSAGGHRIELKEGLWTGTGHAQNLKLFNIPVLKHHDGTGITGALKHTYGILSMADGQVSIRHYSQSGVQSGKMFIHARAPVLNIVDCIWVSRDSVIGYPPEATVRTNTLLAGIDPVALDYHAARHILHPLGGVFGNQHDPDNFPGLISHLTGAQDYINTNGGISSAVGSGTDKSVDSIMTNQGDENIDLFSMSAKTQPSPGITANGSGLALTVSGNTPVEISISLIAGHLAGQPADGWLLAQTPSGWWSYTGDGWEAGLHRFWDSAADAPAPVQVLNSVLPPGDYTFYYTVDDNMDGVLDATWWDAVQVHVTP